MKKILFLSIFIVNFCFGQTENFIFSDSQVQWQKVYETSKSFDSLKAIIKEKNNLKILEQTDTSISGEINNLTMNYRKAGFTYMGTPMILNETNKYSGYFSIDFKEGRYRATVRNVSSEGMTVTTYGGGLGLGSNVSTTLETLALNNKGVMRKNFPKVSGKIIDVTFTNLFDLNSIEVKDDKW